MSGLRIPLATYRLQFNARFGFEAALSVVTYLHRLGITDLYASPVFKARPGSTHGYDVLYPNSLNPELGDERDFEILVQEVKAHSLGLLLDIVPNHMAASPDNPWWSHILEYGPASPYATFFDIDWSSQGTESKPHILLPILDRPYEEALKSGELALVWERNALFVDYHTLRLPLEVKSYSTVLKRCLEEPDPAAGSISYAGLVALAEEMGELPSYAEASVDWQQRQQLKEKLGQMAEKHPEIKGRLQGCLNEISRKTGEPGTVDFLDRILSLQVYRLCFWQECLGQINYRRFFDISDLAGVRVQDPEVLEATHVLAFRLVREGKVTGLRIDHIDGLYDPQEYLVRLQQHLTSDGKASSDGPGFYVVVEKILSSDETLPEDWPVYGSTGYDFLNMLNRLFVRDEGLQALDSTYARLTGRGATFADVVYDKKRQAMESLFPAEVRWLAYQLRQLPPEGGGHHGLSIERLAHALIAVTASLPVYRTYTRGPLVSPRDRRYLEQAFQDARRRDPALEPQALAFLRQVLLLDFPASLEAKGRDAWLQFVMRWQQSTGPAMAKGLEDTALYTYSRLVSLNEVGGDPDTPALPAQEFHRRNQDRGRLWPHTLNSTSTHDTKRGEDVRARLNVLSEMPEEWERHVSLWTQWNAHKKRLVDGQPVPDPDMEFLIYQMLLGAWPLRQEEMPAFRERFRAYLTKAAHEARVFTSWLSPNPPYEDALLSFLEAILEDSGDNPFLSSFLPFQSRLAFYGAINGLAQVLLKISSPGVPDFYRGTEIWDLSLVDPDNRRPVDFDLRERLLEQVINGESNGIQRLLSDLQSSWEDGRIKLYVIYKALNLRRQCRELFSSGRYVMLGAEGDKKDSVFALARHKEGSWALVVVPRFPSRLVEPGRWPLGKPVWADEHVLLPGGAPASWRNIFTGETVHVSSGNKLYLHQAMNTFPVALMIAP